MVHPLATKSVVDVPYACGRDAGETITRDTRRKDVPVSPVSVEVEDASKRARADDLACENCFVSLNRRWECSSLFAELTDDPAKVDVSGEVGTKSDRCKFSGISDGEGLEDAEAVIRAIISIRPFATEAAQHTSNCRQKKNQQRAGAE